MNFYTLLKLNNKIKSPNIKLIGILILHYFNKRYRSVRIDPILSCNLFCRMCYFSSMEQRKKMKGQIPQTEFKYIASTLFPSALQVFIGCGAEPTTHRGYMEIIQLAKNYKVPNVGMVTNGQLLTKKDIEDLIELQLDELTISTHGVKKSTYEHFMVNAKYDRFLENLDWLLELKEEKGLTKPDIRINYTVNTDNLDELKDFFSIFSRYQISTLQIRPVLNIGGKYSQGLRDDQIPIYNDLINQFKTICKEKNIRLLANTTDVTYNKENKNLKVANSIYCYIGPNTSKQYNFDWSSVTYSEFIKKTRWKKELFQSLFNRFDSKLNKGVTNYEVFE